MTPTLRQQIDFAVDSAEQKLQTRKDQPQPNSHLIESEERELNVLRKKQTLLVK
ncbi:hypothetical protein [Granulicella sibirica]|uniref:hypothetical protein n=1 Tax=Granulicella sibirica TaxID=2479048 RepID=UPI0013759A5C|nr:hypothetical protein [Granulicella sibirica]